jgi:hypothetical protein
MEDKAMDPATPNAYQQMLSLFDPRTWTAPFAPPFAPQALSQPILPGWSFGNVISVTEQNSGSPQTERDIVAEHSYGRQLGRLTEALAALIEERPPGLPPKTSFDDLMALRASIDAIKLRGAQSRLQRLESDLATLKAEAPEDYRRIAAAIAADAGKTG